jgi:hypothetical protein
LAVSVCSEIQALTTRRSSCLNERTHAGRIFHNLKRAVTARRSSQVRTGP